MSRLMIYNLGALQQQNLGELQEYERKWKSQSVMCHLKVWKVGAMRTPTLPVTQQRAMVS